MYKETVSLPSEQGRGHWMRLDTAEILKRFFFLERALTGAAAGWISDVFRLETKATLARVAWQNALTGNALRERVFELRFPSRLLEEGVDAPLAALYAAALHAPSGAAFLMGAGEVLIPAQAAGYRLYLSLSDVIADGPSHRFLDQALREKEEQQRELIAAAETELSLRPERRPAAEAWTAGLKELLDQLGGVQLEAPAPDVVVPAVLPSGKRFQLNQEPARDARYFRCSFYWPDAIDSTFPYGDGVRLQLRSAVSHLNEVWAVEAAGAILQGLADELGWEFVYDAARWLYDESRHMCMGRQRLEWWGFTPGETPMGNYISEALRGQDVIYRLGMLGYFETKNIRKKPERVETFRSLGDTASQRDMDFDWADEVLHAEYGRRWLRQLLQVRGGTGDEWQEVLSHCDRLVADRVNAVTAEEKQVIRKCAEAMIQKADARAAQVAQE